MSDPDIACWILGDKPEWGFFVQISLEATVSELKDAIKEKKRVEFDGIDADTLDLYSIFVTRNDLRTALKNINLDSLKNKRLWWFDRLSQVFPDPPTEDLLHIIVIHPPGASDHRMSRPERFIHCWVLGEEHRRVFSVKMSLEAPVAELKKAIKVEKPFDGIDADTLHLYKITVARDAVYMALKNIDPDSLTNELEAMDTLSTVFPDPPDGHLHIIVIRPPEIRRKLVHRPSKTSLYQVFKRQKVVTMAPSELAKPSTYESMQKLSTCRILDDRPEPDLDIPPIPLLYEGFGHFLDIMGGGTDILGLNLVNIRKLQAEVDELACRMCHYYDHEDTRRDAAHPILNRIFAARSGVEIPTIHMDAIGSVKSDGHVLWENGVVTLVTRFKNQALGDNGVVAPDVELVGSIAHLHAKQMQVDEELFLGWRVPCLGLTFVGSDIKFYAIILIGIQYRLVSLTPALSCMPDASDGRDRRALYTAFTAASVLQARIQGDVNRYLAAKPPAIQKNTYHFPGISKLRIYGSSALEYLKFQILQRHDDLSNHWLYFAETGGPDSQTILIKFVRHYSVDLHAFCAKSGHAPQVLAYEKLPGGWHAVAMEYILNGVLITDSPLLTTYRDKWTEEMKTLVQSFHDNGFVHGDLRNPNIICDDRGNLFLIDFDWGGKEGEAFYPTAKLNEELLEGRTSVDLKITRSDDDRVLHKTLDKLKK